MNAKRYTRLKINILLRVTAGAAAVTALTALLVRGLGDREPVSALYFAVARGLFGRSREEAAAFFERTLAPHWPVLLCAIFMLAVLIGFYLSLGKLTGWFDRVGEAASGLRENAEQAVALPGTLSAVEAELNEVRLHILEREREAEENARRNRELVAYLAHDLKTPLTSVVGYLDLLCGPTELSEEERRRYSGIAMDKARRLEELMGEFFDISRLELDTLEKSGQTISLSMLLEQLADEFWPLFEEKGLTFHSAIAPNLTVWGDPDKLARVFDNVLRNAVSYSVTGGVVGLRAFRQGGELVITVDNEGLEIPENELSNIFRKFYRLDAARSTRTGGFGLGLAIAKEIVESHRGSIRAESNGRRVTFTIILPART